MQWSDLWAAFALYLILEGLLPFAHPAGWRDAVRLLAGQDDAWLRRAGLISMGAGLGLLFLVRSV